MERKKQDGLCGDFVTFESVNKKHMLSSTNQKTKGVSKQTKKGTEGLDGATRDNSVELRSDGANVAEQWINSSTGTMRWERSTEEDLAEC